MRRERPVDDFGRGLSFFFHKLHSQSRTICISVSLHPSPPHPPLSWRSTYPEVTNYPLHALRNDPRYVPLDLRIEPGRGSLSRRVLFQCDIRHQWIRKTKCVSRERTRPPSRFMARPRESRERSLSFCSFMNFLCRGGEKDSRAFIYAYLRRCLSSIRIIIADASSLLISTTYYEILLIHRVIEVITFIT